MRDKTQVVDDFAALLNATIANSIEQNIAFDKLCDARKILIFQSGPVSIVEEVIEQIAQVNQDATFVIIGTDKCANIIQSVPELKISHISHNKRFDDSDIDMLRELVKERAIDTLLFLNNYVSSVDFSNVEHVASFAGEKVLIYSYSYVQKELNRHLNLPCHIYGGILYKDLVEWFESYGGWGGDR